MGRAPAQALYGVRPLFGLCRPRLRLLPRQHPYVDGRPISVVETAAAAAVGSAGQDGRAPAQLAVSSPHLRSCCYRRPSQPLPGLPRSRRRRHHQQHQHARRRRRLRLLTTLTTAHQPVVAAAPTRPPRDCYYRGRHCSCCFSLVPLADQPQNRRHQPPRCCQRCCCQRCCLLCPSSPPKRKCPHGWGGLTAGSPHSRGTAAAARTTPSPLLSPGSRQEGGLKGSASAPTATTKADKPAAFEPH
mmetsp:Transcript_18882/g.38911  ORF Transcript_18882/g.38911 Transcript_18882/m.38911 type:complete len:244 (-) Transcript_18882:182-913(-)